MKSEKAKRFFSSKSVKSTVVIVAVLLIGLVLLVVGYTIKQKMYGIVL